jgi:hypothetical protein
MTAVVPTSKYFLVPEILAGTKDLSFLQNIKTGQSSFLLKGRRGF